MSLLQFGFVRIKRNQGDDNDEGTSEKGRSSKEQRLDESVVPVVPNLSTSSSYESRRVQKFQERWLRDFPWLVHESNKNQMHCKFWVEFPALADKSSPQVIFEEQCCKPTPEARRITRAPRHIVQGKTQMLLLWVELWEIWIPRPKKSWGNYLTVAILLVKKICHLQSSQSYVSFKWRMVLS